MSRYILLAAVAWSGCLLLASPASAQDVPPVDVPVAVQDELFLRLDGVPGESMDERRRGEIDVLSWSFGGSNPVFDFSMVDRTVGRAQFSDLAVSKFVDSATPALLLSMASGRPISRGTLTVRRGGEIPQDYFVMKMEEIYVTSIATAGSEGQPRLAETISLKFARFCILYTPITADGMVGRASETCWDLKAAENL